MEARQRTGLTATLVITAALRLAGDLLQTEVAAMILNIAIQLALFVAVLVPVVYFVTKLGRPRGKIPADRAIDNEIIRMHEVNRARSVGQSQSGPGA